MLENLEPKKVFYYFEQISKIPRGSGNEKQVSDYLVNFAKEHNLEYIQDDTLNVVIKKNASKGYENAPSIIIQGHMDMVCEKNGDKIHDFEKDPITLLIDGDYIKADNTTLGADNGIAVAYNLALLDDDNIEHPSIEAVFTSDEEVGMNGAYALDTAKLNSKILINIDSEEEGKLLTSCAGGAKATMNIPIKFEAAPKAKVAYTIKIKDLKGGHSGSDIDKQRANAIKLIARVLNNLKGIDLNLVNISGGAKDNAIPREAEATILINEQSKHSLEDILNKLEQIFKNEFKVSDPYISIILQKAQMPNTVFDLNSAKKVIDTLLLIPNGILAMSLDIKGLVESSNNIGVLKTLDNKVSLSCAIRSSVSTRKEEIKNQIQCLADLVEADLIVKGEYPAWEFDPNSKIRQIFIKVYKDMYNKEAQIEAIHAGLECGLFAKKMQGVDMISFGPDMENVHTPDEKLSISSVARTWDYLKAVLKELKNY